MVTSQKQSGEKVHPKFDLEEKSNNTTHTGREVLLLGQWRSWGEQGGPFKQALRYLISKLTEKVTYIIKPMCTFANRA